MEIDSLLPQWRSSESKLYPMVVVHPRQYETNLELVRAITNDLAEVTTVEELVAAYGDRAARLATVVARLGVRAPSPEMAPLLVDAAFHGRYRELPGEHQQAEHHS